MPLTIKSTVSPASCSSKSQKKDWLIRLHEQALSRGLEKNRQDVPLADRETLDMIFDE